MQSQKAAGKVMRDGGMVVWWNVLTVFACLGESYFPPRKDIISWETDPGGGAACHCRLFMVNSRAEVCVVWWW